AAAGAAVAGWAAIVSAAEAAVADWAALGAAAGAGFLGAWGFVVVWAAAGMQASAAAAAVTARDAGFMRTPPAGGGARPARDRRDTATVPQMLRKIVEPLKRNARRERPGVPDVSLRPRGGYLILPSLNSTCLRAIGSYFLSTSLSVLVRAFFLVT